MRHPNSRFERRFNAETWRNRQRTKLVLWNRSLESDVTKNVMWWARKQSCAHGNRCYCHYEKVSRKEVRKRRNWRPDMSEDQELEIIPASTEPPIEIKCSVCGREETVTSEEYSVREIFAINDLCQKCIDGEDNMQSL